MCSKNAKHNCMVTPVNMFYTVLCHMYAVLSFILFYPLCFSMLKYF